MPADFVERVALAARATSRRSSTTSRSWSTSNRIFLDRTEGVGAISGEEAVDWGWTGPCLRASGVAYDVRKAHPYIGYEHATTSRSRSATTGDTYDRYLVRMEEMRQSLRIIEQALDAAAGRPGHRRRPPRRAAAQGAKVYTEMESLIWHFKLIMEGIKVPAGEAYGCTEGANGELGFYIVSDGGGKPYRIKVRPPCFADLPGLPAHARSGTWSRTSIAILGSLNIIAGELDR